VLNLSGCGDGSSSPSTPNNPPPPPDQSVDPSRYVGAVTIDGATYFGDALITTDGETYLYIGGPHTGDGTVQSPPSEGSISFVSPAQTPGGQEVAGVVIGQKAGCGEPGSPSARWCGRSSAAQSSVERTEGSEVGAIHGNITGHGETWTLDLTPWSGTYNVPARLSDLAGQYTEEAAPFIASGMVLTIDEDGRAFFQTPLSCTGNGTFTPHGDGSLNVFEVEMSIAMCDYPYSQYNKEYHGFATLSGSDIWDYDYARNLRIWLVSFSPSWTAVTMWARRD
jgi:hypothetical protein